MNPKKIAGIVCMVLAAVALTPAISAISNAPSVAGDPGAKLGYAVGALLPVMGLLILGLWLFQKGSRS